MPILAFLMVLLAAAPPKRPPPPHPGAAQSLAVIRRSGELMGTSCTAVVEGRGDSAATSAALDMAWAGIARLGETLDDTSSTGELARLNSAAGKERFACSADLYDAIDSAMLVAEETGGLYDPTIEPLTRAWDARGAGRVPAADEIAAARRRVGWQAVARDPARRVVRFTRAGTGLDLDGIAHGVALDRSVASMRERGIARALLTLGDQTIALSKREPWKATIALPGDRSVTAFQVGLTNAALSTAASSSRGSAAEGVRRDRLLDPRTGMPVRVDASVSVVAFSAARAHALSGALLVMGRERAAAFVAGHSGLGVLWLEPTSDGLNAWAWNLPTVAAEPGINVMWMTPR